MTNSNRPSLPDLPPGLKAEQRVLMTRYAMQAVSEALAAAPIVFPPFDSLEEAQMAARAADARRAAGI